jgi:phage gp36-like protein
MSLLISASGETGSQELVNRYAIPYPMTSRISVLIQFNCCKIAIS